MATNTPPRPASRGGRLLIAGWLVVLLPFLVILAGLVIGAVANEAASQPVYWPLFVLGAGLLGAGITGLVALGLGIAAIVRGRRLAGSLLAVVALAEAALGAAYWLNLLL